MKVVAVSLIALGYAHLAVSQQIADIWRTKWDRSNLFSNISPSTPINFGSPGASGSAEINVDDTVVSQTVSGFGGALTDSSATILSQLKSNHPDQYHTLLNTLFNIEDGQPTAAFSYLRIPMGASDFSASLWTYVGSNEDTSLSNFNFNKTPANVFSTLQDILAINPDISIIISAWSPPGWMKDSNSMKGGNFLSKYATTYANYLLKVLQGWKSKGVNIHGISVQNEPLNSNPSYPTCVWTAAQEVQVASTLRQLMDSNGFGSTKIIGLDHNWSDNSFAKSLMSDTNSDNTFAGIAYHCYSGSVDEQDDYNSAYPSKDIYLSECTRNLGTDWWQEIKYIANSLTIGSISHHSHAVVFWNLALDGSGGPKLPGTNSCGGPGCRPVVSVSPDGSYTLHPEFYTMAQSSRAVSPKDKGGPWGKRINVSVGGELNWALVVGAYATQRVNSGDPTRYSLVVLNWDDSSTTKWNPQPVQATIEFRGKQAVYTFDVGITTLWWYASANSVADDTEMHYEYQGQQPMGVYH